MRVEILGQERRRRWREEDKLAIVMSVGVSGATITEIAHRHDVTRQQIYAWRSELKKKGLLPVSSNALFIPVDLNAVQNDAPELRESCSGIDLPLNFHPAAVRAPAALNTPNGAV
ncbi:transposase [Rhizobium laguerreae]|uniref:Transposase n=1 Tax=Rhizobium laguerreae TaxID=1076926 RepID=A0A7Y2W949_9HYPH|nr:transposase [Rhizobium laguerreae]